jgi:predicted ATPase
MRARDPIVVTFTGAPCAGKTTAIPIAARALQSRGYSAILVQEAASRVLREYPAKPDCILAFQKKVLLEQIRLEAKAVELMSRRTSSSPDMVVLKDRCALDGKAFCDKHIWAQLGDRANGDSVKQHAGDVIIMMEISPANAYEYGPSSTNALRYHNRTESIQIQNRLYEIYNSSPGLRIVHSTDHPADKYDQVAKLVTESVLAIVQARRASGRHI